MDDAEASGLHERARAALQARDAAGALTLLRALDAEVPSVAARLDEALALRMLGDLPGSIAALDRVLILDPRNFLALLSKGALLERMGRARDAAIIYRHAVTVAPPPEELPPALNQPFERAKQAVEANTNALAKHMEDATEALRAGLDPEALGRFDESLKIFSGQTRAYVQEPLLLNYPRLPAIPFHDRAHFPWLAELEAATPMIQGELAALYEAREEDFGPYIAFPPGVPVNQWEELNHSRRWSSFFLWRDGVRQDGACDLCPGTAALLDRLPMQHQPGFAPTAMFSALEPHTRIPPHTGSANTRLLVHLPLVLPGPARFRVGNVTREWRLGEAWVFDDTIEHEAWNDADARRTILIIDIWNPLLSEAEREIIGAMMTAKNRFQAG